MGTKQEINSVEIITTIFDTLWLRILASLCEVTADKFLHFVLLRRLNTSIIVHTITTTNAVKGKMKLLTANETFSTSCLSGAETIARIVLFLPGEKTMSSLLTTYTGASLKVRAMYTPATTRNNRFGGRIILIWKK